jgi:hypothetical protein
MTNPDEPKPVTQRVASTPLPAPLVAVKHEDSNAIQTDDSAQIQLRFSLMNRL